MGIRGRKSADIVALNIDGAPPALEPPPMLRADEREMFAELVNATDRNHFRPTDAPLLVSYVQACLEARRNARDPARADAWERATRLQMALARTLRLTPQSRTDPKTIGRMQPQGPVPWARDDDE